MLAADNLLKALNDNDTEDYKGKTDDHDLGEVLSYFGDKMTKHKLRFSDGTEGFVSFDD